MSMIDWSDPEEMLGLLAEYLRDELRDELGDTERRTFLRTLVSEVDALAADANAPASSLLERLREISDAQPAEFEADPVLPHLHDCIEELSRITRLDRDREHP
jgi:hypothetical protein